MKTKKIQQTVSIKAKPAEVFEALMDSKKHCLFTGAKARISQKKGGTFSAYDGGLNGKNLKIVPNQKIVQAWKCEMEGWPKNHFSIATFSFQKTKNGTRLTFLQTGVPVECLKEIKEGWKDYYWKPMKKMLEKP